MAENPQDLNGETRKAIALRQGVQAVFFLCITAITIIALLPGPAAPPRLLGTDKIEHAAAFALLMLLARLGWPKLPVLFAIMGLAAHGLVIEFIQGSPLLGRSMSFADWIADLIGILLGFLLAVLLQRRT